MLGIGEEYKDVIEILKMRVKNTTKFGGEVGDFLINS